MKEIDIKKIIQKEIAPLLIGLRNDLADNQKALENISEEVKKKSVLEYELEVDDLNYKGEKGDTPIKDIDYPSHDSIFSYIKENLPKKAKDLFTDIDIKNIAIEATKLIDKPEDGINGTDGVNGKDVDYTLVKELIKLKENAIKKEIDKLTIEIYKELKKDKTLSATEIRDSLESLKGSQRLDAKAIKGLEKYVQTFISTQTGGGGGSQNLQQVTDIGATTTNSITANALTSEYDLTAGFLDTGGITTPTGGATSTPVGPYYPAKGNYNYRVYSFKTVNNQKIYSSTYLPVTYTDPYGNVRMDSFLATPVSGTGYSGIASYTRYTIYAYENVSGT